MHSHYRRAIPCCLAIGACFIIATSAIAQQGLIERVTRLEARASQQQQELEQLRNRKPIMTGRIVLDHEQTKELKGGFRRVTVHVKLPGNSFQKPPLLLTTLERIDVAPAAGNNQIRVLCHPANVQADGFDLIVDASMNPNFHPVAGDGRYSHCEVRWIAIDPAMLNTKDVSVEIKRIAE